MAYEGLAKPGYTCVCTRPCRKRGKQLLNDRKDSLHLNGDVSVNEFTNVGVEKLLVASLALL